jgi:hypothetical protein
MHAEITSITLRTAIDGDGTAVFGSELVPAAIRAGGRGVPCTMKELSSWEVSSLAVRGMIAERTVSLPKAALTRMGIGDMLGARVIVQRLEPGATTSLPATETRDVVRVNEKRIGNTAQQQGSGPRNEITLLLSPRRDTGDGGSE